MLWAALLTAPFLVPRTWAYEALPPLESDSILYTSIDTPEALIRYYAKEYGLSGRTTEQAVEIARCESDFVEDAVGDGGHSFGIAQIHLPAHPDITVEQATNKYFATWFLVSEISQNRMWKWSCARILGYI